MKAFDANGHSTGTNSVDLLDHTEALTVGNVREMRREVLVPNGLVAGQAFLLLSHKTRCLKR
jgi:hypothetical protein